MRKALTYFLLLALPFASQGQPSGFISGRLADIAAVAGISPAESAGVKRAVYTRAFQGRSVPVVVAYDAGKVVHIGLDLFSEDVRQENLLVCDFVERYLLESVLDDKSMHWDNDPAYAAVATQGDLYGLLQQGAGNVPVHFLNDGRGTGGVLFGENPERPVFSIRYPSEIQLLSGASKDELEKEFLRQVSADRRVARREIPGNLKRVDRDLYVSENGFYEIAAAQNTAFFRKKGLFFQPVCESSLPVESLMTLLTGYIRKKDYSARVSFHQYGYHNTEVTVPLERLIDCCLAEGCTPYVGIESQKDDSVVATLFLVNAPLGYAHTFQFTVNPAVLDRTDGVLKARGYLYTPLYSKKS